MKMNMQSVLFEVAKERGRQDEKWGGPSHDDGHTIAEFAEFIEARAYRARIFDKTNPGLRESSVSGIKMPRQMLIEIAALAVAAVESIDRNQPNVQAQGRCAALSRSVPWSDGLDFGRNLTSRFLRKNLWP